MDPDVVVEQDAKLVSEGHDPQLETAVSLAMKRLAEEKLVKVEWQAFLNYHQ